MSENSEVMSVHDQIYILDKVSEILKDIEYYSEDNCPEIFNPEQEDTANNGAVEDNGIGDACEIIL